MIAQPSYLATNGVTCATIQLNRSEPSIESLPKCEHVFSWGQSREEGPGSSCWSQAGGVIHRVSHGKMFRGPLVLYLSGWKSQKHNVWENHITKKIPTSDLWATTPKQNVIPSKYAHNCCVWFSTQFRFYILEWITFLCFSHVCTWRLETVKVVVAGWKCLPVEQGTRVE